jgi:hypothetical protein
MGIDKPTTKPNATRSNSSQSGKSTIRQRGTLKIPKRQSSEPMEQGSEATEQDSEDMDKSGPYGFIVHDCNKIQFGFGNFIPEENLYNKATTSTSGLTSTRNACFVLRIYLTDNTCVASYKYLNNRDEQSSPNEMTTLAISNLESLLYNPKQSLDEYNVAKTIEKIIKFKLVRPNQTGYFFVSIDAPNSVVGLPRWHQDSTNISIISDKEVGDPPQRWRKLLNELGITHKIIPGKLNEPIRSDFVLIEYLNDGVSTAVEIKGNVNTGNPNDIARFNTIPGSVILIENPGRKHTAPYMCKSNSTDPNSVDRTEGDKSLQIIMDEKSERTLYRTQLTKINDEQFTAISNLISASNPPVEVNVNVKNIIPFNEISMTEYCTCKRSNYAEYGGKRNKRKVNKTRRKNKRRRSKRTQSKRRRF